MSERGNYIASPFAIFKLDWFGVVAFDAWEHTAYLVGSALKRPDFRDVDVRLLLPDDEFAARFGEQTDWRKNGPLKATNLAWSGFGQHLTGMPIDFQIEQSTDANQDANSGRRHPLGVRLRLEGSEP
jgi:hypothetical protein